MADAVGMSFPFQQSPDGELPATSIGDELLGGMVRRILLTEIGERLMRPFYGSNLRSFLHENIDDLTIEAIKAEVIRAVEDSDPGLKLSVLDVSVEVENDDRIHQPAVIVINLLFESENRRDSTEVRLAR